MARMAPKSGRKKVPSSLENADQSGEGAAEWAGRATADWKRCLTCRGAAARDVTCLVAIFQKVGLFGHSFVVKREQKTFSVPFWSASGRLDMQPVSLSVTL